MSSLRPIRLGPAPALGLAVILALNIFRPEAGPAGVRYSPATAAPTATTAALNAGSATTPRPTESWLEWAGEILALAAAAVIGGYILLRQAAHKEETAGSEPDSPPAEENDR